RHGWPQADRDWALDIREKIIEREEKKPKPKEPQEWTCANCGAIRKFGETECWNCGSAKRREGQMVRTADGTLKEVQPPKPKQKREYCEGQILFTKQYFASRNSKGAHGSTFKQLVGRFHRTYPQFRVCFDGELT